MVFEEDSEACAAKAVVDFSAQQAELFATTFSVFLAESQQADFDVADASTVAQDFPATAAGEAKHFWSAGTGTDASVVDAMNEARPTASPERSKVRIMFEISLRMRAQYEPSRSVEARKRTSKSKRNF
jgi:hypothetical protein